MKMTIIPSETMLVLFDGLCNLCSSSVQFIIRHESDDTIRFASLQSSIGEEMKMKYKIPSECDSIILVWKEKPYLRTDAILRIAGKLRIPYKWAVVFLVIPRFFRDFAYRIIASNRYKWFGRKAECWIPTPELKKRFLDN